MSIKSHAFGRVTLTGEDAKKFKAQVTYGRPKAAAVESAKRGVEMSRIPGKRRQGQAHAETWLTTSSVSRYDRSSPVTPSPGSLSATPPSSR
jgi:hypothetical protein